MSTRNTLLGASALVGAFFVGRMLADPPAAPPPPPPPPTIVQQVQPAQLRSAIRAELQQPITVVQQAPIEEAEPTPEAREQRATALVKAHGVVDAAIRVGRWTSNDARALLAVMPQLGPDEYDEIMSALIRPVNAQQVKVETSGHLLDPS